MIELDTSGFHALIAIENRDLVELKAIIESAKCGISNYQLCILISKARDMQNTIIEISMHFLSAPDAIAVNVVRCEHIKKYGDIIVYLISKFREEYTI